LYDHGEKDNRNTVTPIGRFGKICVIVVAAWLSALPVAARAGDLTLVTGTNYPPFTGPELPNGGLVTEIVDRVFSEIDPDGGFGVEFAPWTRGYQLSKEGQYLGTFPYVRTPEREEVFHYSDPILAGRERFFVLEGSNLVFKKNEDLFGKRICSPRGYDQTRFLQYVEPDWIIIDEPADLVDCFRLLAVGRTGLVPIIEEVGLYTIAQAPELDMEQFRILPRVLRTSTLHLIISKAIPGGKDVIAEFNAKLNELRKAGVIDEITARHLN